MKGLTMETKPTAKYSVRKAFAVLAVYTLAPVAIAVTAGIIERKLINK